MDDQNPEHENMFALLRLSLADALVEAHAVAAILARGPGGREISLVITQLESAEDWNARARRKVSAEREN